MLPTIADGDEIMVDTGDRRVTSRGGIFVVRVDGALMVKRVARAGLGLSIRSDNPAWPGIEDATARGAEVIGRVVWLGRALRSYGGTAVRRVLAVMLNLFQHPFLPIRCTPFRHDGPCN